ncbi:MAG: DNA polymerase I [Anaerovoracaceae bacterium]
MEKRIIIIDGNSLINRAYYAMQRPMVTKDGIYTQGIYGFLNMLNKITKDYPAGYIAVAFDLKAPTFRHKEYEEYKAGRKKMPMELAMQLPLMKEVLAAMNIKTLEIEGYEADDIIGTLALKAEKEGLEPLIITGDKDELQLASEKIKVIITKKGISEFEEYNDKTFFEKYGFTPTQFIDYKGLMGDSSDNIPGLPGVGEKTASKLILEFGNLENLIENVEKVSNEKLRQKIIDNKELAIKSKWLATIHTEVPLKMNFEELKLEEVNKEKLVAIYRKLEFNSFLKRLGENTQTQNGNQKNLQSNSKDKASLGTGSGNSMDNNGDNSSELSNTDELNSYSNINISEIFKKTETITINSVAGLEKLSTILKDEEEVIIRSVSDYSHISKPETFGISLFINSTFYYLDISDNKQLDMLAEIFEEKKSKLIGHNLKNQLYILQSEGLLNLKVGFDTAIAQYVLDSGRSNYSIQALAQEYFLFTLPAEKELFALAKEPDMMGEKQRQLLAREKESIIVISELRKIFESKIKDLGLDKVHYQVDLPMTQPMAALEHNGIKVNKEELFKAGEKIRSRIEELTAEIHSLAGEEFNINSPAQLGPILFEKLSLPKGKKTKTGYSTNADALEKIKELNPIVPLILEYRTINKLRGTYIDGLIPLIGDDEKIRAHFTQTVVATGRLSCTEPNLQNIPIREKQGRELRKAFIPSSDEYVFVGADYSQIELRVLAGMSGDESLIEAFNNGEDIHRHTAARVLGIPEDEITITERSKAKAVNFGVIYGMSAFGLSEELKISRGEADLFIKEYFAKHQKVKEFMDAQIEFCKENGYVETITGRRRYIHEIKAANFMQRQLGERLAMNSPIQGTAADIIKIAMVSVYNALRQGGYKSRLILQVHDELIIETHKEELDAVSKLLKENMEDAMKLSVKLEVSLTEGNNWFELK